MPYSIQERIRYGLKTVRCHFLTRWIGAAALILFLASTARHLLFQSTAFDLGIYDQVVFLMSRGLSPVSSFLGFHHLGNHAAYSVYPLALLYWLHPSVYWLLAVQAICLALGALPTWFLARQAGLSVALASAMSGAYLLYPLVFNVNMFDFHPEVMALPVILAAIWAARAGKTVWFGVALVFILGCKGALSPMVAAMGLWLLVFEKRHICGTIALVAGTSWFFFVTQWLIPTLSGEEAAAVNRYSHLGDSVLEIAKNMLLQPGLVLSQVFSSATFTYLLLLLAPLAWGLSLRHWTPLISALPILTFNILSESGIQRDLMHQYSLPVLPFLLVSVIGTLAAGGGWLRQRRWILLWSLLGFLVLGKYGRFYPEYMQSIDTWSATRTAIAQIPRHEGAVLTDNFIGSHLSQRQRIQLSCPDPTQAKINDSDYVLLNLRHPWNDEIDCTRLVWKQVQAHPRFQLRWQRDDVYLFTRTQTPAVGNS
ncbi:MAG: DUF2079 domain-containing protein [Synechococcales cyanobacterium C42_A2020_086]|jgi:uncharacterized membrane protein|nr:DUF2079 domain-containing protein [Synechococcales cyanobacterium C42_A2020_086]